MSLDTSKPYGLVCGIHGIAKYEQGGNLYDAQHNLLDENGMPPSETKAKAPKEPKAPSETKANDDGEKAALVERAKTLNIKSPHLFGVDKLKEEIAKAEGLLNPDAQLAANLSATQGE